MNSQTDLQYERINYTVVETGKEIRRALKAAFPGVKFSLRGSRGTGYGWFSLDWTDGPTDRRVREVTGGFQSSYFDGMDDSNHQIPATMYAGDDGVIREHDYVCHGVNGDRDYSDTARTWAEAYVNAHGGPELFTRGYGDDMHIAIHCVLGDLDLQGIDFGTLPAPAPGFSGRHVPNSYCLDSGRDYHMEREPQHL